MFCVYMFNTQIGETIPTRVGCLTYVLLFCVHNHLLVAVYPRTADHPGTVPVLGTCSRSLGLPYGASYPT